MGGGNSIRDLPHPREIKQTRTRNPHVLNSANVVQMLEAALLSRARLSGGRLLAAPSLLVTSVHEQQWKDFLFWEPLLMWRKNNPQPSQLPLQRHGTGPGAAAGRNKPSPRQKFPRWSRE